MKRLPFSIASAILIFFLLPVQAMAARLLIPGGQVIGLQLQDGTLTVAAFDDDCGTQAREAGLKIGDEILSVNGHMISGADEIRSLLSRETGPVCLHLKRNGKEHTLMIPVCQTEDGPRIGIHLKQGITGVGTVTWYDPEHKTFGTLGHGVHDSRGKLLNMTQGTAYDAQVISVKKGSCGEPGLLKGSAEGLGICGTLLRNTPQGVFGVSKQGWQGEPMPAAGYDDVKPGAATIRSTVKGSQVQEYSVEILKIYPEDRMDGRNFLIRVTDPDLLAVTGGIVQGMSGSPIIQDGKLIGAVTHVLVNDPTRGYGIFIENMMEAAV